MIVMEYERKEKRMWNVRVLIGNIIQERRKMSQCKLFERDFVNKIHWRCAKGDWLTFIKRTHNQTFNKTFDIYLTSFTEKFSPKHLTPDFMEWKQTETLSKKTLFPTDKQIITITITYHFTHFQIPESCLTQKPNNSRP